VDDNPSNWPHTEAGAFAKATIAEATTREKRPLYRALPPALDFPLDALGPLKDVALAIHHRTQAPLAIAGQSALAAVTLAVQAQRNVLLPAGGCKPLTGLFVSIAESGERKSSVDRLALSAVYQVEKEWRQQSEAERLAYLNAKESWDFSREQAKRTNRLDPGALRSALDKLGPEPKAPPHPMLLISDPTPEALIMHLADGRPFAGVFTAEGGLLIGGAAFSDESKMRTAALLNTLWDGDPIRRKRIGTGSTYLPGRRCSAHIMLQPVIADELFGKSLFDGIGLTARMLLVAPNSTAGTRLYREAPAGSSAILERYDERIRFLLMRPPVTNPEMPDALDPPAMQLHPEAKTAWIAFHDQCESAVMSDGPLHRIKAFAGKLAEHAGRLAAVLTIYDDPNAMEIPLIAMRCGVDLAIHYANEMVRLADGASVPLELRSAQRLLNWWQSRANSSLYLSYIYQKGPSNVRTANTARIATTILFEHGWIERLNPGIIMDGEPRREAWRLIP
jgi:Protein of unknown function (DUF3987)